MIWFCQLTCPRSGNTKQDDSNRSCKLYNCKENGGEYHYLFQCIDVLYRIQELRVYQIQSNSNVMKFEIQCDKLKTTDWNLLIDTISYPFFMNAIFLIIWFVVCNYMNMYNFSTLPLNYKNKVYIVQFVYNNYSASSSNYPNDQLAKHVIHYWDPYTVPSKYRLTADFKINVG